MDQQEYLRKHSNVKCQRVRVEESFVPALQDEEMEVEHLLEQHRNDRVSMDADSLDSHATLNGKHDLGLEVLDGFLDDVEIDDLEGTNVFSGACEEYFLDFEFDNNPEVLGFGLSDCSLLQNSSSESHSSGFSGSSIVGGVSESPKVPIAQSEYKNDSLDGTASHDPHDAFRNNPSQPSNGDCMYSISLDMKHLHAFNNNHPLAGGILSSENEKDSVKKVQPPALREKRFRKPTKRYIEEFSNMRSKEKVSEAAAKTKHLSLSSCGELNTRLKALRKIPGDTCSNRNNDVRLPELKICKGRPKKEKFESDKEPLSSESEDECMTLKKSRSKDRRKNQRLWTLPEVVKLVDGISEYGIGQWTNIKRFFFDSSYRTPTDIRDKWRNLLRASSAYKSIDEEAEQNDQPSLRPLPFDVVHRVRELAKIHPYPRVHGSKKSRVRVCTSAVDGQSKGSPAISLGKRNLRRKYT
ncbi:hypothetical protein RIF29_20380 [Crotalaria pallida]|uniref:Uncharacterized protein n=1 Tax=Crotalaria pallida TaxID=3830 RepID=A0AAN9F1G5_CROPI